MTDSATRGAIVAPSPALALGSIFHTQAKGVSNGGNITLVSVKVERDPGVMRLLDVVKSDCGVAVLIIFTVGRSFKQHQH